MPPPRRPGSRADARADPRPGSRAASRTGGPRPAAADGVEEAASPPRISGGELCGRRLLFVPDPRTRPMKERVRETLFQLLGTDVPGTLAIDLFAGTGMLGFEALSRGSVGAVLVERHFPTADRIKKSAVALGLADRVTVRSGDTLLWGRRLPDLPTSAPWLVFVSPPWSFFADSQAELMTLIDTIRRAAPPGSTLVVEADTSFDPACLPQPEAWESRPVPPAVLLFHHTAESPADA